MISARRLALVVLNIGLATMTYVTWTGEVAPDFDQATGTFPKATQSQVSTGVRNAEASPDSKPLFRPHPTSPAIVAEQAPAALAPSVPNFRLAGIVWGDTEKIAIVEMVDDGKNRRIRVGDAVGDWTLQKLSARTAVVELGETQVELKLTAATVPQ